MGRLTELGLRVQCSQRALQWGLPSAWFTFSWQIKRWHFDNYYYVIHLAVCLTTGPKPLPKPALHTVRFRASSFNCQYPLLSLRSFSNLLRLLPRLPVTSIHPLIFPPITRCRRQFLRKMWPIQLAFRFRISCRLFLCSLTLSNTSSFLTWSVQLIFSILLQHHISKLSRCFWSNRIWSITYIYECFDFSSCHFQKKNEQEQHEVLTSQRFLAINSHQEHCD